MRIAIFLLFIVGLLSSCASKKATVLKSPSVSLEKPTKRTDKTAVKNRTTNQVVGKNTSQAGLDYINKHKDVAIREMNQYGIPASIKLAQALLESGNGNSYLATSANNHFGIKCGGSWTGKSVTKSDDNPNDCFRCYSNVEDSYRDHSQFLLRKRYENLFTLDRDDYKGWARGLKEAGYATNPRYPELLIDIIERYDLSKYDRAESSQEKKIREIEVEEIITLKSTPEKIITTEQQIKAPVAMVIHEVQASQTLYGIARQYNVTVDQIIELNNLSGDSISIGQLLVISR